MRRIYNAQGAERKPLKNFVLTFRRMRAEEFELDSLARENVYRCDFVENAIKFLGFYKRREFIYCSPMNMDSDSLYILYV